MNIKYYTPEFFHELADAYEQAADGCEMYSCDFDFGSEGYKAKLYAAKTLRQMALKETKNALKLEGVIK